MKKVTIAVIACAGISLAACQTTQVNEARLSNGQRVAVVESSGNGLTPPSTTVFLRQKRGFVPVNAGVGQAVIPAAFQGAIGGIAIGTGIGLARPSVTNVSQSASNVARSRSKSCSGLLTLC